MKLTDMARSSNKQINKFMESRFGFSIDFDRLTIDRAERLSETIDSNLHKIRHSSAFHTAERNPRYMQLIAVRESLAQWINDHRRQLTEGEVGTAEVLLAAKDMVDSVQDIIEKIGKMQNEQLPQLLDSIRDQIGDGQADSFKSAVGNTLATLMTQLTSAREAVDNGVRVLSGEDVNAPMDLGSEPAADFSSSLGSVSDFDQDEETDGFSGATPAVGGENELGREKR